MHLSVLTKTGFSIELEGVKRIEKFDEGYYFMNEDGSTLLFVPADNLDHYVKVKFLR